MTYDQQAVNRLVNRVPRNRPRGARRRGQLPSLEKVEEQKGRKVKGRAAPGLAQALTVPGVDRAVTAPVRSSVQCPQAELADNTRLVIARPGQLPAALLQEPPAGQVVHRGGGAVASTPRPGSTTSRTRRSIPPGPCPTAAGPAIWPGPSSRVARPRTRSRHAGWESTTAPASTAPTRPTRWEPPPRTAASGWPSLT